MMSKLSQVEKRSCLRLVRTRLPNSRDSMAMASCPLVPKLWLGNGLPGKLQLRLAVKDLNDCMVFDRSSCSR